MNNSIKRAKDNIYKNILIFKYINSPLVSCSCERCCLDFFPLFQASVKKTRQMVSQFKRVEKEFQSLAPLAEQADGSKEVSHTGTRPVTADGGSCVCSTRAPSSQSKTVATRDDSNI